jgi:Putative zincin peptidase
VGAVRKIDEFRLPRKQVYVVAVCLGILAGVANSFLDLDFSLRLSLAGWLSAALVIVVVLHEALHGVVAVLLGHKPHFGIKPPLIYVTFPGKLPRGHFMLVALAPLVVLDIFFLLLYAWRALRLFPDLSIIINTIGAVADLWIVIRLLRAPGGAMIQDTKTGFEVWAADNIGSSQGGLRND